MERLFSKIMKKSKITSFIELGRPWNGIAVMLFSILGMLLSGEIMPNFWFVLPLVVLLIYSGSSALNDLFDIKVDSINMPFRPLERGSLKIKDVIIFFMGFYHWSYSVLFHYHDQRGKDVEQVHILCIFYRFTLLTLYFGHIDFSKGYVHG